MLSYIESQTEKYFTNELITYAYLQGTNLLLALYSQNHTIIKLINLQNKQEMIFSHSH